MKKLFLALICSAVLMACSKNDVVEPESPHADRTTRAEGDVFKAVCLTENIDFQNGLHYSAIDPFGNVCGIMKAYVSYYDAQNKTWPHIINQQLLSPFGYVVGGVSTDPSGNWVILFPDKLLKFSPDFSTSADYTNAIPQGAQVVNICTNGANIIVALGFVENLGDGYYNKISIYSISSRRVLTHITDLNTRGTYYSGNRLLKAKGDNLYFLGLDGLYFRINLATKVVDSFTPRFTPNAICSNENSDYLYGIDDQWIVQMRFDQPTDYEVGEIPSSCRLSSGEIRQFDPITWGFNSSVDGTEFYIGGYTHPNKYDYYKLYGVK